MSSRIVTSGDILCMLRSRYAFALGCGRGIARPRRLAAPQAKGVGSHVGRVWARLPDSAIMSAQAVRALGELGLVGVDIYAAVVDDDVRTPEALIAGSHQIARMRDTPRPVPITLCRMPTWVSTTHGGGPQGSGSLPSVAVARAGPT